MATTEPYDAIVIGSGQGGTPLARALAGAGRRTAIIERKAAGGTCVNVGCTPTKTMYASAKIAALAARAREYGVHAGGVRSELAEIRKRKQSIIDEFRDGTDSGLRSTENLQLIMGEARFTGAHTLEVALNAGGTKTLSAPQIFINTGGRPAPAKIEGADKARVVDSTGIMELDELPNRLAVIGGGYIGLEFGQMFARFGSRVTIVHRGEQLLSTEDTDVAAEVGRIFGEDGIEVLLSADAKRIEKSAGKDGGFELEVATPKGTQAITADVILYAAGRVPNTDRLDLARAGVEVDDRGFVRANDRLETNVAGIWALGDVKGGPAFTHISYDDYRVIRTNVIEGGNASIKGRQVAYCVYMDPQLGRVGLTEREAKKAGLDFKVAKMEMSHVARALESSETRGFMKVLIDQQSEKILGGAFLGMEGGELMSMLQIAMLGELPHTRLRDAIFAHPTLAEAFNNLFSGI